MILLTVGRKNYSETETDAARRLAQRLGGLPLALVVMSSQIRTRKMSIASFAQLYEKNAARLNKETRGIESFYKHSLSTCWQTTFDFLKPEARRLLGLMAHLGPDAIPEDLFRPSGLETLPPGLEFCTDDWT
jgi:hypothetical protein